MDFLVFFVPLWLSSYAETAEILSPLKTLELPLPPGEREVERLWIEGRNTLCAIVSGEKTRLLRQNLPTTSIRPENLSPLAPSFLQKSLAWAHVPPSEIFYFLDAKGHLHAASGTLASMSQETSLGQISATRPYEPDGYQVSRTLVFDPKGHVYTAGEGGFLYHYSPESKRLEKLPARLPSVPGREAWASLDAGVLGPDGLLYGGTFDGYLFMFHPETMEVVNLGKPFRQQRIQGLAFRKGELFGVGGEDEGLARGFAYDPKSRGFRIGGPLKTAEGKILFDPVGGMVADEAGNIFLGIRGRRGNIYVFSVEERP